MKESLMKKTAWAIIISILLLSTWFVFEMAKNARMETDLDEYMPKEHPAFVYNDQAEAWFNIKDGILIAIENPDGIYNPHTLQKIKDITEAMQDMPEFEAADIISLFTADNIVGTEEGLDVKSFYKGVPQTEAKIAELKQNVSSNEMVQGRLVSDNNQVALVVASINDSVFSMEFYENILAFAHSYEGPESIYVAGVPIVEGTMAYLGPKDMKTMVPIVILVIVIILYAVLRSVRYTLATLFVVLFSTIWAFGLMSLLGIPIYAVTIMIPVMLIAIGVADGIHLYNHLDLFMQENEGATKVEAIKDMLKNMWKPVVMTSVTTAVGFISLLTSEVLPIKYFGLFTAFGVLAAMIFSLVLIPAVILVFGIKRKKIIHKDHNNHAGFAYRFAEKTLKHKVLVISVTTVLIFVSLYGTSKVWINSSFLENFERDSDIVLTDAFINKHFGGTSTINVILESEKNGVMIQSDIQKLMDEMQASVEKVETVGNSFSIADYVKRMNKVMNADKEAFNVIPEDNDLIAQYLLLYEMSGDPENLWKVIDYDYRKANITFQLKSDNSKELNNAIDAIEKYRKSFEEKGVSINYAGSGYKALVFTGLILNGQIKSLILSVIIIILLLSLMFKKLSIGLIGSIPVILTALISFGLMGLLNIPLSTTTALISSIAIGIGIDYAVHFIDRYRINALETMDKLATTRETMYHSGRAIAFNAVVVILGFLVMLFSVFPPNRSLGALVSLNMFISFIATVTIMYLVLYKSNIFFKKKI
jgi:uncharacterized protein